MEKTEVYNAAKLLWRLVIGGGGYYLFYLLSDKIFEIIIEKYSKERPKIVSDKLKFLEIIMKKISDMPQNIKELWRIIIYIFFVIHTSNIYPLLLLFAFIKLIRELSIKIFSDIKKWYLDSVLFTINLVLMFILFGNEKINLTILEIIKIFKMS